MGSFTKQLAKGFVRAAVNQVGRDAGRVISNNVYNGQNYTPYANVSNQPPSINPMQQQVSGIPENAISTTKPYTAGKMAWLLILSFIFMPIGSVGVLIYGILMLTDRSDKVEWYLSEPQYKRDMRYKSGYRYVGNVTEKYTAQTLATPKTMEIRKRKGKNCYNNQWNRTYSLHYCYMSGESI